MRRVGCALVAAGACCGRFNGTGPSSPSPPSQSALVSDDTDAWLDRQVARRVEEGRVTNASAAYFAELREMRPELRRFTRQAKELMKSEDPEKLTRYQQQRITETLGEAMSRNIAENLQKKFKEENEMKLYQQEGVPTGHNYWLEAGDVLMDPSIPPWVRDEILAEMQAKRQPDSPAFQEATPLSEAEMEAREREEAEAARRTGRDEEPCPDAAPRPSFNI
jgi:hypothetical protein